ncbi:MAG: hypothetical protein ABJB55_08445 [Actinomycetota bacterium]
MRSTRIRHAMVHLASLALLSSLMVGLSAFSANAAPGDLLANVDRPAAACGHGGIGVAFDGTDVLYTCVNEGVTDSFPTIFRTDLAGTNLGGVSVADSNGDPVGVDAIAWDPNENLLWGGDVSSDACRVWTVDPTSGLATLQFSFTDTHPVTGLCQNNQFLDGITVDSVTNTLYVSPDVHTLIHHFNKDGSVAANDPIDFESLTAGLCPVAQGDGYDGCLNSGLTIGLDGNLFAGTDGDGKIMQLDPVAPASLLGQFSTVSGRDEDLECGPLFHKTDGSVVETILSADVRFSDNINVLEAPRGTCVLVPTIMLAPADATNEGGTLHTVTATLDAGRSPVADVLVDFRVVSGPNTGEASDPGECSVNAGCTTDASGDVSWTYSSNGVLGTDTIQGCFTDVFGDIHCTTARKHWVDTTPPMGACEPSTNPHGQHIPPAGSTPAGSKGGQNPDGFYRLTATDVLDPNPQVFLLDTGSGTVFGPFASGITIKYTQAPGAKPTIKKMGSAHGQAGAVAFHIKGTGDAAIYAVDTSGNRSDPVSCLVPPPPK